MSSLKRCAGAVLAFFLSILVGCESPEKIGAETALPDYDRPVQGKALELIDPSQYPDFRKMWNDRESTIRALDQSLIWFSKPSSQKRYPHRDYPEIPHDRARRSVEAVKEALQTSKNADDLQAFMSTNFDVYRSVGWDSKNSIVLFTGYYTPIFDGSRTKTDVYTYPLYKLPPDCVKDADGNPLGRRTADGQVVPYYTREEIDSQQILAGTELVWLKTRLDGYIIHVQGSAQITLTDGSTMYVGYAGKTDREYVGLGKTMVDEGKISKRELSLSKIREYFTAHPDEADRYMNKNLSYVFFQESDPGGPYGSIGVAVTPYRTIATDKDIFPWGAPCAVSTDLPDPTTLASKPYVSFAVDQDRGGAIRSAGRCDLYVGKGLEAERVAGHIYTEGKLYYFFVKDSSQLGRRGAP